MIKPAVCGRLTAFPLGRTMLNHLFSKAVRPQTWEIMPGSGDPQCADCECHPLLAALVALPLLMKVDLQLDGAVALKAAAVTIVLHYSAAHPLG